MAIYTNIQTLLRDIIGYMRVTPEVILGSDHPLEGRLGFCVARDPTLRWEISVLDAIRQREAIPEALRRTFTSSLGREALLELLRLEAQQDLATENYTAMATEAWRNRPTVTSVPKSEETAGPEESGRTLTIYDYILRDDL